jgi:uncharacterized protein YjbI with pentapeptide repeats
MVYYPPKSRDELLDRYAAGERYFAGAELDQDMVSEGILDLTSAVLDGADFSNCWFSALFSGASLRATNFAHANVKCCDFSRADLTDADFRGAAMEAATWVGAKVLRTKFGDVSLYGARLSEAEFIAMIKG